MEVGNMYRRGVRSVWRGVVSGERRKRSAIPPPDSLSATAIPPWWWGTPKDVRGHSGGSKGALWRH